MSREQTIRYLQDMAGMREQDLRRSLLAQRQILDQLREKCALLQGYLDQYRQECAAQESEGIAGGDILRWRGFLQQLTTVLQQQGQLIREQEQRLQHLQEQWQEAKVKERGFSHLLQRLDRDRQLAELKRAQKEMDDWALRVVQMRMGV
ncbi:flagellar export protein FliJ [Acidithiobacillus sp. AMEEHan]|uniref:flagellar export protein FliJ n=1 Tax=Acidithiobacillus sp. AMEEHan TaxID=2994951 RepID=UPI0027E596C1|nr:flagellar export protein FliJ [Acidithiobacillus sp. AMEEHan]